MVSVSIFRSLSRAAMIGAIAFAAVTTSGALAENAKCDDVRIDHATGDSVQLLNPDGTAAETLTGVGAPGALQGKLPIYNCNPDYYAVKYNGQKRLVSRTAVVPEQPQLALKPCDNTTRGQLGSSDAACKK